MNKICNKRHVLLWLFAVMFAGALVGGVLSFRAVAESPVEITLVKAGWTGLSDPNTPTSRYQISFRENTASADIAKGRYSGNVQDAAGNPIAADVDVQGDAAPYTVLFLVPNGTTQFILTGETVFTNESLGQISFADNYVIGCNLDSTPSCSALGILTPTTPKYAAETAEYAGYVGYLNFEYTLDGSVTSQVKGCTGTAVSPDGSRDFSLRLDVNNASRIWLYYPEGTSNPFVIKKESLFSLSQSGTTTYFRFDKDYQFSWSGNTSAFSVFTGVPEEPTESVVTFGSGRWATDLDPAAASRVQLSFNGCTRTGDLTSGGTYRASCEDVSGDPVEVELTWNAADPNLVLKFDESVNPLIIRSETVFEIDAPAAGAPDRLTFDQDYLIDYESGTSRIYARKLAALSVTGGTFANGAAEMYAGVGAQVTVTATLPEGHILHGWTADGVSIGSTDNPLTYTVTGDTRLAAVTGEMTVAEVAAGRVNMATDMDPANPAGRVNISLLDCTWSGELTDISGKYSGKLTDPEGAEIDAEITLQDAAEGKFRLNLRFVKTHTTVVIPQGTRFVVDAHREGVPDALAFDREVILTFDLASDDLSYLYRVSFGSAEGIEASEILVAESERAQAPEVQIPAGKRLEWRNGDEVYDFASPVTQHLSLTPVWIDVVTLTFDSAGGTQVAAQTVDKGKTAAEPPAPTRTPTAEKEFTFAGWFAEGAEEAFDFTTPITADLELTARWLESDRMYTVSFDSGDGSPVVTEVAYNGLVTEPSAPTREGYVFAGWFAEGAEEAFDFSTPVSGDLVLYAKWTEQSSDPGEPEDPKNTGCGCGTIGSFGGGAGLAGLLIAGGFVLTLRRRKRS